MAESSPDSAGKAEGEAVTVKDFLKKHVRGIPRDQMKSKVFYGFRYKDLKNFINDIISRHAGEGNSELLASISELEIKLQGMAQYKESMESRAAESAKRIAELEAAAAAAPVPDAGGELQAELEKTAAGVAALESEAAALRARIAELESAAVSAAAENGKLRQEYEALEKESEFLDSEMEKLNAKNRAAEEETAGLRREFDLLGEKSRKDLDAAGDQIASLKGVIEKSKDMQKVLAVEEENRKLRKALEAMETAAEFMAAERMPDFGAAGSDAASAVEKAGARSSAPCAAEIGAAAAAAKADLDEDRKALELLTGQMYSWKGDFETAYSLGCVSARIRAQAERIGLLKALAEKLS